MAVVVATGIAADGSREVLGLAFLLTLRQRGLGGVQLVIADQHSGLVAALMRSSQHSAHQRCRVHFARKLLARAPKTHADMVAAIFRTIFAQPDPEAVSDAWDEVRDQLAASFPTVGPLMDQAKAEGLAFTGFPKAHWRKISLTNPLERVNEEIKRRSRVVRIFPTRCCDQARRRGTDRHARRVDRWRPPLPLKRIHGAAHTGMDTGPRVAIQSGE